MRRGGVVDREEEVSRLPNPRVDHKLNRDDSCGLINLGWALPQSAHTAPKSERANQEFMAVRRAEWIELACMDPARWARSLL
jgi:hypothetical protein